jgi:hypothetical protein
MRIEPNNGTSQPPATNGRPAPARPTPSGDTTAEFRRTDSINASMQGATNSRPEEVARAKELVATNQYPPPVMIGRIARLLAMQISSGAEQ